MNTYTFSNRDFRKRFSDGRQKKGGVSYLMIQDRTARLEKLGVPAPAPSVHARMRKKGVHGPAPRTKARAKWLTAKAKFEQMDKRAIADMLRRESKL